MFIMDFLIGFCMALVCGIALLNNSKEQEERYKKEKDEDDYDEEDF